MAVQTQIQVRRGTASSWTSTNPTLAAGELGFETDTGKFKIGTGSGTWTSLTYAGGGQNTLTTYQYTATSGQTTFSGADSNGNTLSYTVGNIQVYLNGVLLVNTAEYTATNGTSVVLGTGAVTGDSLTVISLGSFTVSSDIPKSTLTAKGSIVTATAGSTPANLSVGANDTVLTADSSTATGLKWAAVAAGASYALFRDEKTAGTAGGTATNGAFRTRDLNTSHFNNITGASLASNQVTLPAGTFYIHAIAPERGSNSVLRWYNITDSALSIAGQTNYYESWGESHLMGFVTTTGSKTFELQQRFSITEAGNGLGVAANYGQVEVYAMVSIVKVA